jgi:hypothetical protein
MKIIFRTPLLIFALSSMSPLLAQWKQCDQFTGGAWCCFGVSGKYLFAGTNGDGVFRSTDKGTSWTELHAGLIGSQAYLIYSFAVRDTSLIAGTYGSGIFRSNDNGTSWTAMTPSNGPLYVTSLAVFGTNLFAGTDGIFRSTDDGTSWTAVSTGYTGTWVYSFATLDTTLFAGSAQGVFRSTNNGTSWTRVDTGMGYAVVRSLAVIGTNIFAGTDGDGVFRSTNNGTSWVAADSGLTDIEVFSFAVVGRNIFAGTYGGGVFLSTDNGSSWTSVNTDNTALARSAVWAFVEVDTTLFAGSDQGLWFRPLSEMVTGVQEQKEDLPTRFSLQQNYPNPFNPTTVIGYLIPAFGRVTLKVYDVLGRELATLVNEDESAGYKSVTFNASKLSAGVYFYKLHTGNYSAAKKLLLLK